MTVWKRNNWTVDNEYWKTETLSIYSSIFIKECGYELPFKTSDHFTDKLIVKLLKWICIKKLKSSWMGHSQLKIYEYFDGHIYGISWS